MNIRDIQNALIESADLVALAVCRRNAPKSDMMTRRKLYESSQRLARLSYQAEEYPGNKGRSG